MKMTSWPGALGPLGRQMGVDPIDDLLVVAGIDHKHVERLAVGVAVIADQHVVENPTLVVGDQGVADLAKFHVGHAAGEQFGQKDRRPGPLEPQPAHMRNIDDAGRRAGGLVLLDDGGILNRHRKAGELDHAAAVSDVPIIKGGMQRTTFHGREFQRVGENHESAYFSTSPRCEKGDGEVQKGIRDWGLGIRKRIATAHAARRRFDLGL